MTRAASDRHSPRSTAIGIGAATCALLVYVGFTAWLATTGHFGNDELFTLYFSRLPDMGQVWQQLATGVEQTPPFFYVVTRASLSIVGDSAFALRLPEVGGVAVAATCVAAAVTRRSNLVYGSLAALVVLGSQATFYAHEARPYGLVLGLVAAGFLFWQLRIDDPGGIVVVGLMTAALTAAVASHYYAVLALLPIAAGEIVRGHTRKQIDVAVAVGLAVALVPLAVAWPLIDAARRYSDSFWTQVDWAAAVEFTGWLFRTAAVPGDLAPRLEVSLLVWALCGVALHALLATSGRLPGRRSLRVGAGAAAIVGVIAIVTRERPWLSIAYLILGAAVVVSYAAVYSRRAAEIGDRARNAVAGRPEVVAAGAFLLVPLLAVTAAKLSTGAYTPRYVIPSVIGVAYLLPLGLHRIEGARKLVPITLLCILTAFATRVVWYQHLQLDAEERERRELAAFVEEAASRSALPIVIAHPQRFFELAHDRSTTLDDRLLHLVSLDLARRFTGSDSTEAGLLVLREFAPVDVRDFEAFEREGRPFLILVTADPGEWNWIVPALEERNRPLQTIAADGDLTLIEAG